MTEKTTGYLRFAAMIVTSMVVMFAIKYTNTYAADHVFFSETRFFMTLMMGAAMAVVMLGFMLNMYKDWRINLGIAGLSAAVFFGGLWLMRSQATIEDESWMKAMIPHHSIAIMTSERAGITDVRVQALADAIIAAQQREIAEMKWLLDDISQNGEASTRAAADARPVPDFSTTPG